MTAAGFRLIALAFDGVVESAHMGHPDFRVNGRIFATLKGDKLHGMVKLTPAEQAIFIRSQPDAFAPESGAWGRAGCTRVTLKTVDEEQLGEAMTLAWRSMVNAAPPKTKPQASARKEEEVMGGLLQRILRWLGIGIGPGPEPGWPGDPYARKPAPVRSGPKSRSGAVAVAEPED